MPLREIVRGLTAQEPVGGAGEWLREALDARRRPAIATPIWALAYVVASLAGRELLVDVDGIGAVWPSVGVGFMWLSPWLFRRDGLRVPAFWGVVAYMLAVTPLIGAWTGLAPALLPWGGLTNVVAAVLSARLYAAFRGSWRCELLTAADLALLALACTLGMAVAWLTFPVPGIVAGVLSWSSAGFWYLRNYTSLFYFAVVALLFLGERRRYIAGASPWRTAFAAIVVTALVGGFVLHSRIGLVVAFLFLVGSVAAASYLSVLQSAAYLVVLAIALTGATVLGYGPYVGLGSEQRAVLIHVVLVVSALVTLSLALDREERAVLFRELQSDRAQIGQQADLLRTILGSMSEGILVRESTGSLRMQNEAAVSLLGEARTATRTDVDRGTAGAMGDVDDQLRDVVAGPATDLVLHDEGGNPIRVVAVESHVLLHPPDGGSVAILRDVTDERRHVSELRTFARVAAHDLRQPLTAIELWVDTLRQELRDADVGTGVESLDHIEAATQRMQRFLRDLVNYTLAQQGRLALTPLDLQELLVGVVADLLAEVGNGPRPEVSIDVPYVVRADRARVRQVFDNVISNAMKYAREGDPARVTITAEDSGDGHVRVEVADRGIGVPPGQERLVFEEFHRVPGHSEDYPGTGLGLAICKRIVERHHGAIAVRAREGGGTCVDVTFPA